MAYKVQASFSVQAIFLYLWKFPQSLEDFKEISLYQYIKKVTTKPFLAFIASISHGNIFLIKKSMLNTVKIRNFPPSLSRLIVNYPSFGFLDLRQKSKRERDLSCPKMRLTLMNLYLKKKRIKIERKTPPKERMEFSSCSKVDAA